MTYQSNFKKLVVLLLYWNIIVWSFLVHSWTTTIDSKGASWTIFLAGGGGGSSADMIYTGVNNKLDVDEPITSTSAERNILRTVSTKWMKADLPVKRWTPKASYNNRK